MTAADLFLLILPSFKGNMLHTAYWFLTPNPLLGNISPNAMIETGRIQKLHKFIIQSLKESTIPY